MILLKLRYIGTNYAGFQIQENAATVQGCLEESARKLFGGVCAVTGCGRTDSGVHAFEYYATIERRCDCVGSDSDNFEKIPIDRIPRAMNAILPHDISVLAARIAPPGFHAIRSVKIKEYEYKIHASPHRDPFLADRAYQYYRGIDAAALARMRDAAAMFCGRHDFRAFMASGSSVKTTVREVYSTSVEQSGGTGGETVIFRASAGGFLYNMMRIMAGTLLYVAEGKIEPGEIPAIIESGDRRRAGFTAPPHGLYLRRVVY